MGRILQLSKRDVLDLVNNFERIQLPKRSKLRLQVAVLLGKKALRISKSTLLLAGSRRICRSAEVGQGSQNGTTSALDGFGNEKCTTKSVKSRSGGGRDVPISRVRREATGTDWEGKMIGPSLD